MGDQHNELRRGQLSAALSRALGDMRGGGLERYGETVDPVIDLWDQPEWAFLRAERLVAISRAGPAVLAEFGTVALLNPTGSQAVCVVEEVTLDAGTLAASTLMNLGIVTEAVALATIGTPQFGIGRDTRFIGAGVTLCTTIAGSDPANLGSVIESVRVPAGNMPISRSVPYVLSPGFALWAQLATVNTSFLLNLKWRERRGFPSELG